MNAFELRRLKQEGKDITLPGGINALGMVQMRMFEDADERLNRHLKKRQELDELQEICDMHGRMPTIFLGC